MPPFNLRSLAWPRLWRLARFPDPKSCFSQRVFKEGPRAVWARARSAGFRLVGRVSKTAVMSRPAMTHARRNAIMLGKIGWK